LAFGLATVQRERKKRPDEGGEVYRFGEGATEFLKHAKKLLRCFRVGVPPILLLLKRRHVKFVNKTPQCLQIAVYI
jgi:hypothetical protein